MRQFGMVKASTLAVLIVIGLGVQHGHGIASEGSHMTVKSQLCDQTKPSVG